MTLSTKHHFYDTEYNKSTVYFSSLFVIQDYIAAMEDFQQSLELKKNQPIAMLYKGLTFFHRGLLKVKNTAKKLLHNQESLQIYKPSGLHFWVIFMKPLKYHGSYFNHKPYNSVKQRLIIGLHKA